MKADSVCTALVASVALASCSLNDDSYDETLQVNSNLAACIGVIETLCLMTRTSSTQPWELFYGPINGFDYQWGKAYVLRVRVTKVNEPIADGSSLSFSLLAVLSQIEVPRTETFQIKVPNVATAISPVDSSSKRFTSTAVRFVCQPTQCAQVDQLFADGASATFVFDHANSPLGPLNLLSVVRQ